MTLMLGSYAMQKTTVPAVACVCNDAGMLFWMIRVLDLVFIAVIQRPLVNNGFTDITSRKYNASQHAKQS